MSYTFALTCRSHPTQAEGRTDDDRPYYFRARGGAWTLDVGEPGWPTSLLHWPVEPADYFLGSYIVARGRDGTEGCMSEQAVRAILDRCLPITRSGAPSPTPERTAT